MDAYLSDVRYGPEADIANLSMSALPPICGHSAARSGCPMWGQQQKYEQKAIPTSLERAAPPWMIGVVPVPSHAPRINWPIQAPRISTPLAPTPRGSRREDQRPTAPLRSS